MDFASLDLRILAQKIPADSAAGLPARAAGLPEHVANHDRREESSLPAGAPAPAVADLQFVMCF